MKKEGAKEEDKRRGEEPGSTRFDERDQKNSTTSTASLKGGHFHHMTKRRSLFEGNRIADEKERKREEKGGKK